MILKLVKLLNKTLMNNNNNNILMLILICLINNTSQGPIEFRRYCGDEIPEVMKLACKGQYNGHYADDQPSIHSGESGDVAPVRSSGYYDDMSFFTNRRTSYNYNTYTTDNVNTQPKIVDECCHKPCGPRTLRTYCDIKGNYEDDLQDEAVPERPPPAISTSNHQNPLSVAHLNPDTSLHPESSTALSSSTTTTQIAETNKNKMVPRSKSYEIGTVSSAESNPHPIHDISSRAYHDISDITKTRYY